jgi:hypothetical protein
MIKRLCLPLLTLGLAAGFGVQQEAQKDDLEAQVTELEARLDRVEGYLAAQATAEAALVPALDKAVKEGYTSGINFPARETLISAWRARAAAAQKNIPGAKKAGPTKRVDPRLRRRKN